MLTIANGCRATLDWDDYNGKQPVNSRLRLQTTLNHKEPDRVALDIGATGMTGIHINAYRRLREHIGLPPNDDISFYEMSQQIVRIDEDVYERLGIDVRPVSPGPAATDRLEFIDLGEDTAYYNEWGVGARKPKDGGLYYSMFDHPLAGAQTVAELEAYPWPDPLDSGRFIGMRQRAKMLAEMDSGITLGWFFGGILESAGWVRGVQQTLMDLALNVKFIETMLDKILEIKLAYWEAALAEVGDNVDAVIELEDLGTQKNLLISPRMYRKYLKPRHKRLFDLIHSQSEAKIFLHSCGAIRPLIPDLIEVGVDILNPVQVSAAGMDTRELKREFGNQLTFWGGGVDTQRILDKGTPQEVGDDVRRHVEDLAPGGGFVFAAVHNIQGDVPPENIMAMWEALQQYGVY